MRSEYIGNLSPRDSLRGCNLLIEPLKSTAQAEARVTGFSGNLSGREPRLERKRCSQGDELMTNATVDGVPPESLEPGSRTPLLINRNFASLWAGQAISYIGDFVFDTTLILWIASRIGAGQSWAALAVSGLLLGVLIPDILVGPFAGVFVDRWDKRRTMLAMDIIRVGLILSLLPATGLVSLPGGITAHPSVGVELTLIYGVVVLTTSCQQFFGSSRVALIGDVVPAEEQSRASGLAQITSSFAGIIGPPLAAPLLFGAGVQWALILNAASFLASFAAVWLVRTPAVSSGTAPDAGEANVWREFRHGLTFYFGNRTLVTILITGVLIMLGAGALNALDIFFVTVNLHTSPALYGWLSAGFSVGAIAGGLLAATLASRIGPARMLWGGMIAGAIGIFVYSRLSSFVPAVILLTLLGLPVSGVNIAFMPLILQSTPRELIGRVTSVFQPALSVASVASIAIAGLLVSTVLRGFHAHVAVFTFGPVDTVFTGTAVLALAGGVYAMVRLEGLPVMAPARSSPEAESSANVEG